jgi:lysozyme
MLGLLGRMVAAIIPTAPQSATVAGQPSPDRVQPPKGSDPGLVLLKHYESCRLKPYLDGGGVPTIGWGNTYYEDGRKVTMADAPITQTRADDLLARVYGTFRTRVAAALPQRTPENQIGALACFAYNVGFENFRTSTAYKLVLAGDLKQGGAALEWWNKDAGLVVRGLQKRRRAEKLVLMGADPAEAIAQAETDYPKRQLELPLKVR